MPRDPARAVRTLPPPCGRGVHGVLRPSQPTRVSAHLVMGERPLMIEQAATNIRRRHADKFGPFAFEHPSVAEGCEACHFPHGSMNAKRWVVFTLCLDTTNAGGRDAWRGCGHTKQPPQPVGSEFLEVHHLPRADPRFRCGPVLGVHAGCGNGLIYLLLTSAIVLRPVGADAGYRRLAARRQCQQLQHHAVLRTRLPLEPGGWT